MSHIKINAMLSVEVLLLVVFLPNVMAQNHTEGSKPELVRYAPGQVWTMDQGITVTVFAIEDVRKVGRVVHVRVDKIPWQKCGNIRLTRAIEHLAVTEKTMQKSGLVLSKDNAVLPDSSIEAYRKWEGQKKHEITKEPLQKAIWGQGDLAGPMICNLVPSQT